MPGDGILTIGATVDKTGVEAGLSGIQDGVQTTVQSIAVQVEETCSRTKAAWNKLGEDVKAAAQSVSAESLKVAEATKAQTAALADLRRASVLSKDAKLDEATSTGILAAAQVKVAASSAAVAAAKKEEAAAVASAAEEEALSSNLIIAAFQRAALGVRESCTSIQEKLIETAETGKLSAEGITAGFAGLGSLLGAGILVGFAAHFLDETSKMEIELAHLHEKTGIAVQDLAGLQQIVRESGADWDAIATGLVKMDKALADANEPSKQLVNALSGIGLKVEDLKGLQPEVQLQKIATAFAATENVGNRAYAATALFGRGGQALIPILVSQGAALHANIEAAGKLTGVTDESVKAAFTWQQTSARLSAEFRSVMVPTIEIVEKAIAGILGVIKGVDAAIWTLIDAIGALGRSLGAVGGVLYDAMTGHFGQMKTDAQELTHDLAMIWEDYGTTVAKRWKETAALMTWQPPKPTQAPASAVDTDPAAGTDGGNGDGAKGGKGGAGGKKLPPGASAETVAAKAAPPETQSPDMSSASAELIAILQAEVEAKQDAIKSEMEAERSAAEEKIRIAAEDYADVERNKAFEVRMGRMTAEQRIAALRVASNQENQIRQQQSMFIQMLDMNDQKAYERDLKQEEQSTRQHLRQIAQLNQQAALDTAKSWQLAYSRMTTVFSHNMAMWATGQESLAQSWRKTIVGMTQTLVENLIKQTIAFITSATTQEAVQERQKLKDAAAAARKTYVAVAAIPYVGPFLAPAAAAGAFAAVEAFEQGGIVGGRAGLGVPILAHAGERVLTQSQTTNFEKMVNQSSSSSASSAVHFHDHSNWSGVDGASVEGMYRRHAQTGRREMMRQLRLANQV